MAMKKKKKKPTAIDKAIILLKDIRKNGTGRTLAQLLIEKGFISEQEFFAKLKQVQLQ